MAARIPKVSIAMPVYNGERYLASAIEASLGQTHTDFELIVSDNASTDRTAEISQEYARKDSRIRYVRNPTNLGMAGNYNSACRLSVGEYFRWAAGDDLFSPESLASCVEVLDKRVDVVLAYSGTVLIDSEGNKIADYDDNLDLPESRPSERFISAMKKVGLVNLHFGLIRSAALKQTCIYHPGPGGDLPFIFELALHGKFVAIRKPLFFRRVHDRSSAVIAKKSSSELQKYLDPTNKITGWYYGPLLIYYFGAIMRPPIPLVERLRAAGYLIRYTIWSRHKLKNEVKAALFRSMKRCHLLLALF